MNEHSPPTSLTSSTKWCFLGNTVPRSEVVYFVQIFVIYSVIISSIINLSIGTEPISLWISLLSSCLGYVLPSPSLKSSNG